MTDSVAAFPLGWRLTDSAGVPVSGGYLMFRHVSSATPYSVFADYDLTDTLGDTVYLNSAGQPVASEGSGTTVAVYVGTDPFAVDAYDADGVLVPGVSLDGLKGAITAGGTGTSSASTPVISKTTAYTVLTTDAGKLINANPTGGSFTISLPSAITAGDGFRVGVRHNGSTNTVTVVAYGSETISRIGVSSATVPLTSLGECVWLVSNGALWTVDTYVPPLMSNGLVYCKIADRLTAPPTLPTAGARYIINGTPTGAWTTLGFAHHDIAESDGNGSWLKYTPGNGWMAWVDDEDLVSIFHDGAWVDQTGMPTPGASDLQYAVFEHQETNGTAGGAATASAWTTRTLNTTVANTITGASLAASAITLPVGKYLIICQQSFWANTGTPGDSRYEAKQRINAGTATMPLSSPMGLSTWAGTSINAGGATYADNAGQSLTDSLLVSITAAGTVNLQYFTTISSGSSALGKASGESSGAVEVYARVLVVNLSTLQGPRGEQGPQGLAGFSVNALDYATGDGVTDDAAGLQNALNAATGSTLYIPDGTYLVSAPLVIPTNCAVFMASNAVIRATAAMDAVIKTDAAVEHLNNIIEGGYIDCADLADSGIWLKWFSMFRIEDVEIWDNLVYGIRLGRAAGTSSYEVFISDTRIRRSLVAAPAGTYGIYFENAGDSHVSETIIMGQKYGIGGTINDSKFDRVHVWNPQQNGAVLIGFAIGGGDNVLSQCQVDGDCTSNAYYLNGNRNKMVGCCANHVSWGTDNAAGLVYVEAGYKATVVGCSFKGYSGAVRWGADFVLGAGASIDWFSNDVTNTVTTHANGLWMASASVIDFGNGDVRMTHSADALSFSGAANGYTFNDGPMFHGANSVPTSDGGASLGTSSLMWASLYNSGITIQKEGSLVLANGANSNITLPAATWVAITGPTGAFSVSGFGSPTNGQCITLYNTTAQNMTITNDATSTAANRILTLTGADVALTGTSLAHFRYSAASSRWILTGTQG